MNNKSDDATPAKVTSHISGQVDIVNEIIARFPEKGRIFDIGTGSGLAARAFLKAGWDVKASGFDMEQYFEDENALPKEIDLEPDVDICDMRSIEDSRFDAVWCAHVLEHVSNTGDALSELRRILKPNGWLFIAVPPFKPQIVGGHVNAGWNIGSLMYILADAGFDLANGQFVRHGYNVFGMVQRGEGPLEPGRLRRANGDIETLVSAGRFPHGFDAGQGFEGNISNVNWKWSSAPFEVPVWRGAIGQPGQINKMRLGLVVPNITRRVEDSEKTGHMMANAMAALTHISQVNL